VTAASEEARNPCQLGGAAAGAAAMLGAGAGHLTLHPRPCSLRAVVSNSGPRSVTAPKPADFCCRQHLVLAMCNYLSC